MNFEGRIENILKELKYRNPGIRGSALVSGDGLAIVSMLPNEFEADRVAGMNSVLLNIGINSSAELNLGDVEQLMIRGENGYLIVSSVADGAMLLVLTDEDVKLGAIFFFMKRALKELREVL